MKKVKAVSHFITHNKNLFISILFLAVITDIFFIVPNSDTAIFSILGLYIVCIWIYKLPSKTTFLFTLLLLLSMYIQFLRTHTSVSTEKAAVWLVLFMIIGVVQQWRELK